MLAVLQAQVLRGRPISLMTVSYSAVWQPHSLRTYKSTTSYNTGYSITGCTRAVWTESAAADIFISSFAIIQELIRSDDESAADAEATNDDDDDDDDDDDNNVADDNDDNVADGVIVLPFFIENTQNRGFLCPVLP